MKEEARGKPRELMAICKGQAMLERTIKREQKVKEKMVKKGIIAKKEVNLVEDREMRKMRQYEEMFRKQ